MNGFELGNQSKDDILKEFIPSALLSLPPGKPNIPSLAKDLRFVQELEAALPTLPTFHHFHLSDSVRYQFPPPESIHLVLTSPPYWTLKRYHETTNQLGHEKDYSCFLAQLSIVWEKCFKCLLPGGRLIIVVGDVCLSRRQNKGRHTVVPLHA